jgi:hypothetical protein
VPPHRRARGVADRAGKPHPHALQHRSARHRGDGDGPRGHLHRKESGKAPAFRSPCWSTARRPR